MRLLPAAVLTAALAAAPGPSAAGDWDALDAETLKALTAGGPLIAVRQDAAGALEMATAATVIDAPPDRVAATMLAFAEYPAFMPQVEKAEVVSRDPASVVVDFTLKFELGALAKRVRYRLHYELVPGGEVRFRMVQGDLARNDGGWTLRAIDGGRRTILFYSNRSEMGRVGPVVDSLLEKPSMQLAIATSGVAVLVGSVKKRVEGGGH